MKLKKIYMYGFKSFAEKTEIEVKDGITSIIGPNGSGKSNVVDAIRWVLGEQSVKTLRGQKSQDIIFAGTQFRKSLGFAEVSITFDNTTGEIPIEYDEVVITRRLYRDGESGYYINGALSKLKTIQELFMDTGIGKDGYSIIGQGRIDEILSNNSEERRKVFEEATGIVKYRERKKEAVKNIENTENNLVRINDIILEIEGNLENLKEQSQKAIKYLEIKEKKKKLDLRVFIESIRIINEKNIIYIEDLKKIEENIELNKKNIENVNKSLEEIHEEIKKIEKETEEGFNNISEIITVINNLDNKIEINKEKKENILLNIQRLTQEVQENNAKIEVKNLDKEKKLERISRSKRDSDVYKKELEEKEKELESKKKSISDGESIINTIKKELEEFKDKIYEIDNDIFKKNMEINQLTENKKVLFLEKSNLISNIDKLRTNISEEKNKFSNDNKELLERINNLEKEKQTSDKKINSINELKSQVDKLTSEIHVKKNKLSFLENLEKEKNGFSNAIKVIYKEIERKSNVGNSAKGIVADILDVEDKYLNAIQTAVGSAMQNIIVEDENDAKNIIEFFKNNKSGRATFLPLSNYNNKIVKSNNDNLVIATNIEFKKAIDVIKVDSKFQNVINYIVSNTYIVNNMDDAIELSKKVKNIKIITIDGDILNPSGSITGGYQNKQNNLIGRKNQIKELEEEINSEIKILESKKSEYEKLFSIADKIKNDLKVIEIELSEKKIEIAIKENNIKSEEEKLTNVENRLENIKREMSDIEKLVKNLNLEISKKEEEKIILVKNQEESELKIKDILEKSENGDLTKQIEELTEDIMDLKISINSFDENEKSIQEIIDILDNEISNLNNEIVKKEEQIVQSQKEITNLETENTEIEKESLLKKEENEKIKELQTKMKEKKEEISKREDEILRKKEEYNNIEKELFPQKISKEQEIYKLEVNKENLITNIWEEYELTLNNIQLDLNDEIYITNNLNIYNFDNELTDFNVSKAKTLVNELNSKLKKMGEVNISAIEEYSNIKERYDFLSSQKADLDKTKNNLLKIINDISTTMEEQFLERLKLINKEFEIAFTELFGGGRAKIELEDITNPLTSGIEIRVEPPGKKLQNLTLLSGGERAFTAIAILFAILNINPSPFSVLDEIEAALDDANVQRYANYLKKYARDTQFLIITHRKGTMEVANTLYGVTMEENGVSKLVSLDLRNIKD